MFIYVRSLIMAHCFSLTAFAGIIQWALRKYCSVERASTYLESIFCNLISNI